MAQYATGISTKNRILAICKELFYHKGYTETTFNEICEKAQVNRGSIAYHYASKKNIAAEIYGDAMKYISERIVTLFGKEEEVVQLILQLSAHQRILFDDACYRRFSIQFSADYYTITNISDYKKNFSNAYNFTLKKMVKKRADFYFAGFVSMDVGLESYIDQNIESLTFAEVMTYSNEIYFSFLPIDELEEKIRKALHLMNSIEITNKGFDISIEPIKLS